MTSFLILHIDDDVLVLNLVRSALSVDRSLKVLNCASAEEGLRLAIQNLPDLILCDVEMPGLRGTELLKRLQATSRTAEIPLIFITARNNTDDSAALMALGATAVITKPFRLPEILATICNHLPLHPGIQDSIPLAPTDYDMSRRLRDDAATLESLRLVLATDKQSAAACASLRQCAHKLAGAAGLYELLDVSDAASAVEQAVIAQEGGSGDVTAIDKALQHLLSSIECARGSTVSENFHGAGRAQPF